jgi:hypothetical protein
MDVKILDRQFLSLLISVFGAGFMSHSNFYENHIAVKIIGSGLTFIPLVYSIILNRKMKNPTDD